MENGKVLLNPKQLDLTMNRLSYQLIEDHNDFSDTILVGMQPRGSKLSGILHNRIKSIRKDDTIRHGLLDISFYRDDFRRRDTPITVSNTEMPFDIEGQRIVLIDDVLYTGRSVRSAMDALMDLGRPKSVEFLVLIDRRFSRELPIQPDYMGRTVDAVASERIDVIWEGESGRVLLNTMKGHE
jgi:pyrimidine operon attenuation protein/uracil phosphoribosyltransferase